MLRMNASRLRRWSRTTRCTAPALVTMAAIVIAIIARVAAVGFAVIGLRGSRRSRGRVGAAVAADAAVTALDTSSFRSVADNAHSSAVAAPIRRSRRLRFPIENAVPFGSVSTAEPAISHTPRSELQEGACARRPRLFNDLTGLRASSDAGLLLDRVASLENRAGSPEKRCQAAGIVVTFHRRFSGEALLSRAGSPEKRWICAEIPWRSVRAGPLPVSVPTNRADPDDGKCRFAELRRSRAPKTVAGGGLHGLMERLPLPPPLP